MDRCADGVGQGSAVVVQQWRKSDRRELHWRDWGEDSVVFELRSGITYQFSALAAAVMACFEAGPQSRDELAAAIAGDLGTDADANLVEALDASVAQFLKLGWIEPIPPA